MILDIDLPCSLSAKNFNGKTALIFLQQCTKSEISQNIYLYIKTKYHYLNCLWDCPSPHTRVSRICCLFSCQWSVLRARVLNVVFKMNTNCQDTHITSSSTFPGAPPTAALPSHTAHHVGFASPTPSMLCWGRFWNVLLLFKEDDERPGTQRIDCLLFEEFLALEVIHVKFSFSSKVFFQTELSKWCNLDCYVSLTALIPVSSLFFFCYLNLFPIIYDVYLSFEIFITVKLI